MRTCRNSFLLFSHKSFKGVWHLCFGAHAWQTGFHWFFKILVGVKVKGFVEKKNIFAQNGAYSGKKRVSGNFFKIIIIIKIVRGCFKWPTLEDPLVCIMTSTIASTVVFFTTNLASDKGRKWGKTMKTLRAHLLQSDLMLHINRTVKTFYHFMACKAFGESCYPLRAKPLPSVSARRNFIFHVLTDEWYQSHLNSFKLCTVWPHFSIHFSHLFCLCLPPPFSFFHYLNFVCVNRWHVTSRICPRFKIVIKEDGLTIPSESSFVFVEGRWKEKRKIERERRREQVVVPLFSFPILACALTISTVSHLA